MAEFLEEQLARLRRMLERMSEAHSDFVESARQMQLDREMMRSTPIHDVRDLRSHCTHDPVFARPMRHHVRRSRRHR